MWLRLLTAAPCEELRSTGETWVCREEQRQVQKRKKRRAKGPSCLSFADEVDGDTDEDDSEASGMIA
jgi:protein FAM50